MRHLALEFWARDHGFSVEEAGGTALAAASDLGPAVVSLDQLSNTVTES